MGGGRRLKQASPSTRGAVEGLRLVVMDTKCFEAQTEEDVAERRDRDRERAHLRSHSKSKITTFESNAFLFWISTYL